MNLKTHSAYPEGQKLEDGSYVGRFYDRNGTLLEFNPELADRAGYLAWVAALAPAYLIPEPTAGGAQC